MKFIIIMMMVVAASIMVQSKILETFIVNGTDTTATVRFYAYLEIFRQPDVGGPPFYFGGGTLISTSFVLTCAQNVAGFTFWRIGLGAIRISDMQWFLSTTAFIHHGYNNETLVDNVALLRLTQLTSTGIGITPLNLPTHSSTTPVYGFTVNVYGFGFGRTNHQPEVLQRATFNVTTQQVCGASYPHLDQAGHTGNHFCGIGNSGNICAGDQGGPATTGTTTHAALVGIQSFFRFENCGLHRAPAAFIRLPRYVNWINGVMRT